MLLSGFTIKKSVGNIKIILKHSIDMGWGELIHAQFIMVIWALCGGHRTVAQLAKEVKFL